MNWFTPSVQLQAKWRDAEPGELKRRHDAPQTPLDRLVGYYAGRGLPPAALVRAQVEARAKTNQFEVVKNLMAAIKVLHAKRKTRAGDAIKKEARYA